MKCDELKAKDIFELENYIHANFAKKDVEDFYPKSKVDEAITEMKDESNQLKRTLWLARAESAFGWSCYNGTLANGWKMYRGDPVRAKEYEDLKLKWKKVEQLCRDKADSFLCEKK